MNGGLWIEPVFNGGGPPCPELPPRWGQRADRSQQLSKRTRPPRGGGGRLSPAVWGNTRLHRRLLGHKPPDFSVSVVRVAAILFGGIAQGSGKDAGIGADGLLDGIRHIRVLAQEGLCVFTALPDALAIIGEP